MNNPLIFNKQEVIDRYRFHEMVHKFFELRGQEGDLTLRVSIDILSKIYNIIYPENVLTDAIINNMLVAGGFTPRESAEGNYIFAILDEKYFQVAILGVKIAITNCVMSDVMRNRLHQYMLNKCDSRSMLASSPVYFIELFLRNFCILKDNTYNGTFDTKQRSRAVSVYSYYISICAIYEIPYVNKLRFYDAIVDRGFEKCRGYVEKCSGMVYFNKLYIPLTDEDMTLSLEWHMGVVTNAQEQKVTSRGTLLDFYDIRAKEAIIIANKEAITVERKPRAEKTEGQEDENDDGRADEAEEISICEPETSREEGDDLGYPEEASLEQEDVSILPEDKIMDLARTIGIEQQETVSANTTPQFEAFSQGGIHPAKAIIDAYGTSGMLYPNEHLRGVQQADKLSDSTDNTESEYGDDGISPELVGVDPKRFIESDTGELADADDGCESIPVNEPVSEDVGTDSGTEPSLIEIAKALKVPCNMEGREKFTPEVMQKWITNMGLTLDVSLFYTDIMQLID